MVAAEAEDGSAAGSGEEEEDEEEEAEDSDEDMVCTYHVILWTSSDRPWFTGSRSL